MRHKVAGRKFDRNMASRKALLRNLVSQLFKHDRIVTTEARAKEVRGIAEKLITKAKKDDLHSRRQILKVVTDKRIVKRLFDSIMAKLIERNTGGYTRIIKLGYRKGDDAPMALLEIIEPDSKEGKASKISKKKASSKTKAKKAKPSAKGKTEKAQKPAPAAPTKAGGEKDKKHDVTAVTEPDKEEPIKVLDEDLKESSEKEEEKQSPPNDTEATPEKETGEEASSGEKEKIEPA